MLHEKIVKEAADVVGIVGAKRISVVPGSTLDGLYQSVASVDKESTVKEIARASDRLSSANGIHHQVEADAVRAIVPAISGLVKSTTATINPLSREIIKCFEQALAQKKESILQMPIVASYRTPAILLNEDFLQRMEALNTTLNTGEDLLQQALVTVHDKLLREITTDELDELLSFGQWGEEISGVISGLEENLAEVIGNVGAVDLNYLLIQVVFTDNLVNAVTDKAELLTADEEVLAHVKIVRNKLVDNLLRYNKVFQESAKINLITPEFVRPKRLRGQIVVNDKIYTDWIRNKGGSTEALLGAWFHNDKNVMSLNGVVNMDEAKLAEMVDRYAAARAHSDRLVESTSDTTAKQIIRSKIAAWLLENFEGPELEEHNKRLLEYCTNIAEERLENIPSAIRKAVCYVVHGHFDAHHILCNIADMMADDIPKDQAVLHAYTQYVARWVGRQLKPQQ